MVCSSQASSSRSCTTACATASPRCRRHCRTRAAPIPSHGRRWVRGADSSPGLAENMEYVITPAVVVGAMGFLSHDIVFDLTGSRRMVEQPGSVVGDLLHHLRRDQHHGHRDHHAVHRGDHRRWRSGCSRSFSWPCSSRGPSTAACSPTSRRRRAAAASCLRASPESSPPYRSRSGSTWRSRNCRSPPKSLTIRSGTFHARPSGVSTRCVVFAVLILFLNTGVGGGAAEIGTSATPFFDGFKAVFGEGTAASVARAPRAHRADRQLLHDHLRLRSQHVLAVPRRLFPAEPVDHPPDQAHAVRRAHCRRGDRIRCFRSSSTSWARARALSRARSSARCCTWPCSVP